MPQPPPPGFAPPAAIIVMGVSGAGKTTLAQLLASQLNCPFIEGDLLHDARCIAKMQSGQALTDDDRWPWLDRIGAALHTAVEANGNAVAACSALRRAYRERLATAITGSTLFLLLEVPRVELGERLAKRSGHFMPASLLSSQLATLERPAEDEHALILDAQRSPADLCAEVLTRLSVPARTTNDASG